MRRGLQGDLFQLTAEEAAALVSQNAIPSRRSLGGYLPLVFTQEGIAMLSSVLRSPRAIRANIEIMRAFVYAKTRERWRSAALTKLEELERKVLGHDRDIERLFEASRDLMDPPDGPPPKIGFRTEQPRSEQRPDRDAVNRRGSSISADHRASTK